LYGLSLLLEKIKNYDQYRRPEQDGGNKYNEYHSIPNSINFVTLQKNITNCVKSSGHYHPFVIRYNQSDVIDTTPNEKKRLPSEFFESSIVAGTKGSFEGIDGPWYAQAYGGEDLPEYREKIRIALESKCTYRQRNNQMIVVDTYPYWCFHVGGFYITSDMSIDQFNAKT